MNKSFYDYSKLKSNENKFKQNTQNFQNTHYQEENFEQKTNLNSHQTSQNNQKSNESSQTKNIEDTINYYKDMSQDDLMANLLSEVAKQKQQGTFDVEKLEKAISSFSSFLTPEQQKNMRELLNKIK
jgi:hypothetical protein